MLPGRSDTERRGGDVLCRDFLLDEDVKRMSSCELEVDVVAADILNRLQVDGLSHRSVYKYSRLPMTLPSNRQHLSCGDCLEVRGEVI